MVPRLKALELETRQGRPLAWNTNDYINRKTLWRGWNVGVWNVGVGLLFKIKQATEMEWDFWIDFCCWKMLMYVPFLFKISQVTTRKKKRELQNCHRRFPPFLGSKLSRWSFLRIHVANVFTCHVSTSRIGQNPQMLLVQIHFSLQGRTSPERRCFALKTSNNYKFGYWYKMIKKICFLWFLKKLIVIGNAFWSVCKGCPKKCVFAWD